jgi:hypothetical protein
MPVSSRYPSSDGLDARSTVVSPPALGGDKPVLVRDVPPRSQSERTGAVIGTTSAFLDLAFGLGPATLGFVARQWGEVGSSWPAPLWQPPVSGWSPRQGSGAQSTHPTDNRGTKETRLCGPETAHVAGERPGVGS